MYNSVAFFLKKIKTGLLFICWIFSFIICLSCGLWLLPPLRVVYYSSADNKILVEFSQIPSQSSIRRAFRLTENGSPKNGFFIFDGRKIFFIPENGFFPNRDYELIITTEAETEDGNSLSDDYVRRFSSRTEYESPVVVAVEPVNTGAFYDETAGIVLRFSEAVETDSFTRSLRFSPSFKWLSVFESPHEVRVLPAERLVKGQRYVLELGTGLCDLNGNSLRQPFVSSFKAYPDTEIPDYTISAQGKDFFTPIEPETLANLPLDAEIILEFTEEMKIENIQSLISIVPPLAYTASADREGRKKLSLSLGRKPEWKLPYTLTVKAGASDAAGNAVKDTRVFRFACSLEQDRPVRVIKGFFDLYPDESDPYRRFTFLSDSGGFGLLNLDPVRFDPSLSAIPVNTDIYFAVSISSHAKTVPLASALSAVQASASNGCALFLLKEINVYDSSDPAVENIRFLIENDSDLTGSEGKLIFIKVSVDVSNRDTLGLVYFSLRGGLCDDLGNSTKTDWTVILNKI